MADGVYLGASEGVSGPCKQECLSPSKSHVRSLQCHE
jgi:hypothetical protein